MGLSQKIQSEIKNKMFDKLYNTIEKKALLSKDEKKLCENYFEPIKYARNSILEEENKKPQFLYFINSGFMRLFYYDDNGEEVTTMLSSPNDFFASFLNFIHEKPSKENVESITDCHLLRISRPNLATLIDKSDNFKNFSLTIFEQAIASSQTRANDFATLTAELRYRKLIDQQPELVQNVPVQYVASYLGIKPQSLSRIRKQMIK